MLGIPIPAIIFSLFLILFLVILGLTLIYILPIVFLGAGAFILILNPFNPIGWGLLIFGVVLSLIVYS